MVFGFFKSLKFAADVRTIVAEHIGDQEASHVFDQAWVVAGVDLFFKEGRSASESADLILVRVKYEPKSFEERLLANALIDHIKGNGLDLSSIHPNIYWKLCALAIRSEYPELVGDWFLDHMLELDTGSEGDAYRFFAWFNQSADQILASNELSKGTAQNIFAPSLD